MNYLTIDHQISTRSLVDAEWEIFNELEQSTFTRLLGVIDAIGAVKMSEVEKREYALLVQDIQLGQELIKVREQIFNLIIRTVDEVLGNTSPTPIQTQYAEVKLAVERVWKRAPYSSETRDLVRIFRSLAPESFSKMQSGGL